MPRRGLNFVRWLGLDPIRWQKPHAHFAIAERKMSTSSGRASEIADPNGLKFADMLIAVLTLRTFFCEPHG